MKYFALILLLVLFAGCSILDQDDENKLELKAELTTDTPDREVTLTLTNFSEYRYVAHPDLCGAALERQEDNQWSLVSRDLACTEIIVVLESGDSVVARMPLDSALPAGTYRYRYEVGRTDSDERTELYSKPFDLDG